MLSQVYDLTDFQHSHPGGQRLLLLAAGRALYHGPLAALERHLAARLGLARPNLFPLAEWASELVCDPLRAAALP